MPSLDRAIERARLDAADDDAPRPTGFWPFCLTVHCAGPASAVLAKVREVMHAILLRDPEAWPPEDAWPALLPGWFVAACLPERTAEEMAAELAAWRARLDAGTPEPMGWSVADFVWWFTPEMRHWWWWSATTKGSDSFVLTLVADEVDPPHDALLWLLRAAGATEASID
ncbi:hypothetical protein [Roseomonas rosulenta]|uniref:hypothetical protein n=1 Tax=Roseomonas rosulenta TaxID=2748667 RepID=UPI0018DF455E|nr:hypothetical protein [Roseomonas rosulenta]